jgi:hypothetical protein
MEYKVIKEETTGGTIILTVYYEVDMRTDIMMTHIGKALHLVPMLYDNPVRTGGGVVVRMYFSENKKEQS